ncbi:hypothetical protein DPMN_003909 [Dreissena polymorpha]|uniref:Uncharacterized protein n=1 Tax=Dreissena polymorpha TaxID=45954 RepID=A0A9D4MLU6_DREPO|nr:hypothetical protein DPMN_003909 [Dreissena polymorpha]
MYQMAMTNTAASNRILAQHKDLTNILEGATLRDVVSKILTLTSLNKGQQLMLINFKLNDLSHILFYSNI